MIQTTQLLIPILNTFTTIAGAGILASWIFSRLRAQFPVEQALDASPFVRSALALLHAPRYARFSALMLAALISLGATALLALIASRPVAPDVDAALSAALAAIASQIMHSFSVSGELPEGLVVGVELDLGGAGVGESEDADEDA